MTNLDENFVIGSFSITTTNDSDYQAYYSIPNNKNHEFNFERNYIEHSGYNPGSEMGNRQECKVCGKAGSECLGHPIVMDLEPFGRKFLSEFGLKTIEIITNVICVECKTIVKVKKTTDANGKRKNKKISEVDEELTKKLSIRELSRLPLTKKICVCQTCTPTIVQLKEEKPEGAEKRQKYAARDVKVKDMTADVTKVAELIKNVDFSRFDINKENIINLFFDKMILLPTSNHQMAFRPSDGGVDEITGFIKLYASIWRNMNFYGTIDGESGFKEVLKKMYIGEGENKIPGTPSYLSVMNGKEGLYRNDAINKRAIGTGRAVITLGTKRSCEIQLPEYIQKNLYYAIEIMSHNLEHLQTKVGLTVTHLITPMEASTTNNRKIYLRLNTDYKLKKGDVVLKYLEDGDHVVFSRHPTLWRHSQIGYVCFGWQNKCIGVPETSAPGHNADFDGDEGNILVGANLESRIEMELISARFNLFGAHSGEPVIGITYNGIVGAYVLSTDNKIDPQFFEQLVEIIEGKNQTDPSDADNYVRNFSIDRDYYKNKAREHEIEYYSGRILISMLLPKTLNYKRDDVLIKKGIMLKGELKKTDVGNKLISAISVIDPWRGPYLFVDRGYVMMSRYISSKGITISSKDYIMPNELRKKVEPENWTRKLIDLDKEVQKLEMMKTKQTKASRENTDEIINHKIESLIKEITVLFENGEYRTTDIAKISYMSGARGNTSNVTSAVTCVGQQYNGANRLGLNDSRLTVYSDYDSKSIFDKGFVKNSFSNGLSPHEIAMLASPSRIAAFTVYLGTPESGNASRQIVYNLAGLHTDSSLNLVNRQKKIVDCLYGIGCDPARMKIQQVKGGNINSCVDVKQIFEDIEDFC